MQKVDKNKLKWPQALQGDSTRGEEFTGKGTHGILEFISISIQLSII